MKNLEKYKDELFDILIKALAVDKRTKKPKKCSDINCESCLFSGDGRCYSESRKWLEELYNKDLLDSAEREYLSQALAPFIHLVGREKIMIAKSQNYDGKYSLLVLVKYKDHNGEMQFPTFPNYYEMYKNLEVDRVYTAKELKLTK